MDNLLITLETLQNLLISHATGGSENDIEYQRLRHQILSNGFDSSLVPRYLVTCRNLSQFWQFIKFEYGTYAERRDFIWKSFQPLFEKLEKINISPSDNVIKAAIQSIDSQYIHLTWQKALGRRQDDPEGAITIARTLLESTCKYILDDKNVDYGTTPDLNHLYRLTAKQLNIAPSDHTQSVFKQILGGCTSVIEGLGALRNRISDAHGQGKINFRPASRHAELAVNLAGTMAVFLFSTWEFQKGK
ncbi:abortive infection family protein [Acinetobacter calcoaceticus]|uniref:abortive infection family protein n=1 Tax=Acinetobacter calcoaceticus TaxID=471 RepID=UPI001902266A|nr:abortive infection family protein [Acinetobacter calcoaceticus]MBJ9703825.1 abortive infection family protein [Acinetobacter calcoaceticus]